MQSSLPNRLFRLVFGWYVVLAVVVTTGQLALEYVSITERVDDDLTSLASAFARGAAEALWTYDQPLLETMARGVAQSSVVTGVRIENAAGRTVAASGETFDSAGKSSLFAPYRSHAVPLTVRTPRDEELRTGSLTLFSSRDVALARVKDSFIVIFVNSLIKTAGLWLIFSVVITRVVAHPLSQAANTIATLDHEQEDAGHPQGGEASPRTELDFLFQAMEDLRERLATARRETAELQQSLERKVEERTRDLERSNAELQQFAYAASHDMREPLRMIASYLVLLERRLGTGLDEDGRDFLAFARDGAKRLDQMIVGLLEYSRIGRTGAPNERVPLAEAAAEALGNLRVVIEQARARIAVDTDLPDVVGHRPELVRLLQNLIANAIKYRSPDRTPAVTVSASRDGDSWLVAVADNGVGIPADQAERVFGIFQRLHGAEVEGCGIGLANCKKIVESMGGTIWLESEEGKGTTFLLTLPAATA